jgi:hypothetical protein
MRRALFALVNLAAIGILVLYFVPRDEADRVRRTARDVAGVLSRTGSEPPIAVAGRMARLKGYLAEDCTVDLRSPAPKSLRGRDVVAGAFGQYWGRLSRLQVELRNMEVDLGPEEGTAGMRVDVVARGPDTGPLQSGQVRPLFIEWVRVDGEWRIAAVSAREEAEPAPPADAGGGSRP